jgi:hypothetical protein
MIQLNQQLEVRISLDGNIELEADNSVPQSHWQKCVAWWSSVSLPSDNARTIKVSVPNFEARKNW